MAYLKPPWFTRAVFNKIAMATGMSNTEKLTVSRRRSKQPQKNEMGAGAPARGG
jgi:hypothetical protein